MNKRNILLRFVSMLRLNIEHPHLQCSYLQYSVLKVSEENQTNFSRKQILADRILHY